MKKPSAIEEFGTFFGFLLGACATFFGIIAIALSIVNFAESGIGGIACSVSACFAGAVCLFGSLHKMDEL